jgi:hypothetical protein
VTCESNNGNRKYCGNANPNQVSLQRQLSQSPCVRGQSWGVDEQGLWVDRGCRAEFNVGRSGGFPGNGGNGQITCESNNGARRYCGRVGNDVTLQQQLSQSPCVRGQSWGVDGQGLWVDRGCRAVFFANGNNFGPGPGSSNYPRVNVDTSGRGNFNGRNFGTANITRGWVDTRSQPTVSLTGSGGFSITFYGTIIRSDGDRSMTMQITGSSRGPANGRADIYLNQDRNEVESININGNNFNGNFSRK